MQTLAIRGPVNSASPFLENLIIQKISVLGLAEGMIRSAYISNPHSLRGHNAITGKACKLIGDKNCLRGSVVVLQNALHRDIVLKDINFDADLPHDLSYTAVMHELFIPKNINCSKGKRLAHMYSGAGMWSYMDPSRSRDSSFPLPAAIDNETKTLASLFLPARPQTGQSDGLQCIAAGIDPMDCCFTTVQPAAACYYKQKDLNFIPASMTGNLTFVLQHFEISIQVSQTGIPITYAEDIPDFQVGPVFMSCSDITFY